MKHAKMLAILAVAAFCISAFAIAIDVDNSSADGEKQTYSFYLQLKDGDNKYNARLADVVVDGAESSSALYKSSLITAVEAAGGVVTFNSATSNMVKSIEIGGHVYAKSGTYGTDPYYGFAVYKVENGAWAETNLSDGTMMCIVLDKYEFSEPSDASKYMKHEGDPAYWTLLPSVEIVDYKIYIQCEDDDGSSFSKWIYSKQMGISQNSLESAKKLGAKEAGFEIVNDSGFASYIQVIKANGHDYKNHGTWNTDGYYDSSTFHAEDNKWVFLDTAKMDTDSVFSFVFGPYKFADPQDDSYYHVNDTWMGEYWIKNPTQSPSDADKKAENNNLVLYIAIGAVAVVAVAAIAFFVLKKKA